MRWFILLGVLVCAAGALRAQNQQARHQPGWPCTGTVDPFSVRSAEATGGKVLLLQPRETSGITADMTASRQHDQIVLRASARVTDGVYDFEVPIDSTIDSAYFFISIQCVQFVNLFRPSGDELRLDATGVEHREFEAVRMVTIAAPSPGIWKVRIAGRGVLSLIVSARTEIELGGVAFFDGDAPVKAFPPFGKRVRMDAQTSGVANDVTFQFTEANGSRVRSFILELGENGAYSGEVTLPTHEFRVAMIGHDSRAFPFERMLNRLFTDLR
jgi:hypothetical protein